MDIISILSKARVLYQQAPHPRVRRGWVGVDCPKCSPGHNKFRLGFELATGRAHCWVCGTMYAAEVLALITKTTIGQAKDQLQKIHVYRAPPSQAPIGAYSPPQPLVSLLPTHRHYLYGRGLDPDYISSAWRVQATDHRSKLPWRLFIPVLDLYGREVSWTTRTISPGNPKRYWAAQPNQESVPLKSLLYGANWARHTIVIVEGPVDAWSIGYGAVCTCGVGYSDEQMALMSMYPNRIVCFDAEDDAQQRAEVLCNQLSLLPGDVENITLETGKDPNEAEDWEIEAIRARYFPEMQKI